MTNAVLKEKILRLEAQVGTLMSAFTERPDFSVDERNWRKIRPAARKARRDVYRETYGRK